MSDLFQNSDSSTNTDYSAKDIEVLEGLEPVRRRPGMYIGGIDVNALHHLATEVLDNAMDEIVAGHAKRIVVKLLADGSVEISDDGRGIPVDMHPKYPNHSALEIILTTLHSGGKFGGNIYRTSGGLHGVGISVVNALSDRLTVEVVRERQLYQMNFSRGHAQGPLTKTAAAPNRRGTLVRFHPDPEIFGSNGNFNPAILYQLARSKAYLFRGAKIKWWCDPSVVRPNAVPLEDVLHFPAGLADFLSFSLNERPFIGSKHFTGLVDAGINGKVEWAVAWLENEDGFISTYCNTIPTPQGGSHEQSLRTALLRSLKEFGELIGNRRVHQINSDDITHSIAALLSVFISDPHFQGQTKEKLISHKAGRLVESIIKDHFDHFLSDNLANAALLLDHLIERSEERLRRRVYRDLERKTATNKLRLPGKLADCSRNEPAGTELFIVEGDSAGGSAKQARERETQAVLPLRGKILNVASSSAEKLHSNQELKDLTLALGTGTGDRFDATKLRYERIIIMTDADVDGAHIAALLITFFYREMPGLIESGHLYLAKPPLYRLTQGDKSVYAHTDVEREIAFQNGFKGKNKIEVSRFKGLGEMPARQLRDTTMSPSKRKLIRILLPTDSDNEEDSANRHTTKKLVEGLMGRKPEFRFQLIKENARFVQELDV